MRPSRSVPPIRTTTTCRGTETLWTMKESHGLRDPLTISARTSSSQDRTNGRTRQPTWPRWPNDLRLHSQGCFVALPGFSGDLWPSNALRGVAHEGACELGTPLRLLNQDL